MMKRIVLSWSIFVTLYRNNVRGEGEVIAQGRDAEIITVLVTKSYSVRSMKKVNALNKLLQPEPHKSGLLL